MLSVRKASLFFTLICWVALPSKSFPSSNAIKPSAKISNATLVNCTSLGCIKITSESANEGYLVRGISFGDAQLKISDKVNRTEIVHMVNNAFLDYRSNRIFIEGLDRDSSIEAIYDLRKGSFRKFYLK